MRPNNTTRHINSAAILGFFAIISAIPQVSFAAGFTDPLGGADPAGFLKNIITFLLGVVGGLALIALIWGGIMYIISLGDNTRVEKAKKIITMAVVGLVVVILAMSIINVVTNALGVS